IYSDVVGGMLSMSEAESRFSEWVLDNKSRAPEFSTGSPSSLDGYSLKPGSSGVDGSVFLTEVTSSGRSKVVPVADTRFFSNGFGIVDGDRIQLEGTTSSVEVVEVDHAAGTLTLQREVEFSSRQGIALQFSGAAPDVGAVEYRTRPGPLPNFSIRRR